ncbi:MAG: hypothetical protein JO338_05845 [Aquitalea sp.]|nr:hypothetical protein [Aquitalea sp.]
MNTSDTLLKQLASSPEAIAAIAVLLLLLGMTLVILLRRQPKVPQSIRRSSQPPLLPEAVIRQPSRPAQTGTAPAPATSAEEAELEDHEIMSYEVDDLDALAEIDVFMEFGYLEQAALALRTYVDGPSSNAPGQLGRLAELYLQLRWIDDYSDILERQYEHSLLDRQQLHTAILAGLQQDHHNLALRVMADSWLGLGIEEINQQLGDQHPEASHEELLLRAVVHSAEQPAKASLSASEASQLAAGLQRLPLVAGQGKLAPLNQQEIKLLTTMLPPARQASILLACHQPAAALPSLQLLAKDDKVQLSQLVDTLRACYMTRNLPLFCRYLWQLHLAIGNFGLSLKQSLFQLGCQLGQHPALMALEHQPDRLTLEAIGRQFGYIETQSPPVAPLMLVTAKRTTAVAAPSEDALNHALTEAEQFIDYGQIDMAIRTLEDAILHCPLQAELYPPLLKLYEQLGDLARFTWLTRQIRERVTTPPDEITGMLARFVQTMQQRLHQHRFAA